MSNKAEKRRRKVIVTALKAKEYEEAYSRKPIPDHVLLALFDHLETSLFAHVEGRMVSKCDHTLNTCRAFLEESQLNNIEEICEWFGEYGGFCDCEVAYNVADYWEPYLRTA